MNQQKQKRLKKKGWAIGDTSEFLGMTPEEEAYLDLKHTLAQSLRQRRLAKKFTQKQLAQRLQSSQSRVAKMEAADPNVTLDLLLRAHFTLGLPKKSLSQSLQKHLAA